MQPEKKVSKSEKSGWEQRQLAGEEKGARNQAHVTEAPPLLTLPAAHPGPQRPSAPSSPAPLRPRGGPTSDWLSRSQSALPLCSQKRILPQLCDRFLSAICVEIIPLLLPNIIYSCLIFSLYLKAAKLK